MPKDPGGVSAASACRVRRAGEASGELSSRRHGNGALKADKAFQVVGEAAWVQAGGPEKARLVLKELQRTVGGTR